MCLFKKLMIPFLWLLPLRFFPSFQLCALILSYECFLLFLNSVAIPQVSLTEITAQPLQLFLVPLSGTAQSSPGLMLLSWVNLKNAVVPICWWKDDYLSLKQTLWQKTDHPKAVTQTLVWKSPLETRNTSSSHSAPGTSSLPHSLGFSSLQRDSCLSCVYTCPLGNPCAAMGSICSAA